MRKENRPREKNRGRGETEAERSGCRKRNSVGEKMG